MADAHRCRVCGRLSGDLDSFDAKMRCSDCSAPARAVAVEKPDPHIPYSGPLPAYDPQVQEDRDFWAGRIGRVAAEDLCPECDPLPEERRF